MPIFASHGVYQALATAGAVIQQASLIVKSETKPGASTRDKFKDA
jgi:methionine aminopeptidase